MHRYHAVKGIGLNHFIPTLDEHCKQVALTVWIIVLYMKGLKPTKDVPEPYKIEAWAPIEGGLRFDYREHYATYDDPLNCMVRGLWIDPEGSLVCYSDDETTTLVRTDETFDDPINTRRKKIWILTSLGQSFNAGCIILVHPPMECLGRDTVCTTEVGEL